MKTRYSRLDDRFIELVDEAVTPVKSNGQPQHEDPGKKLQKYADLRQKGLLTEEEFQKLKADLLSQI